MTFSIGRTLAAALTALVLVFVAAGCGSDDKKSTESVQTVKVPPLDVKKLKPKQIKPVPQASKFTGAQNDVATDLDKIVAAVAGGDGKFLCAKGYAKADLVILNKGGKCVEGVSKALDSYLGYRLDISKLTVIDATNAKAMTRLTASVNGKPFQQQVGMKFVKEDGFWRLKLDLAAQQKAEAERAKQAEGQ
ncbi:MAG: hypothetical protein JHC87_01965 [Thermoleophilaceae bacterium]|nr:hypothetical protein [Thermoleophilaceae bacterium]